MESALHLVKDDYTYMFTCHALNENFSVLIDENVRLSFLGVGKASLE